MEFLSQCVFWSFGPEGFGNVCCRYIRLACCLCTRIWEDFLRCSEGAFPLLPLLILDVLRFTSSRDIQSLCEQMLRSIFDTRDNVTIGGPQNVDRLNPRTQTRPECLVPHASVTLSLQEHAPNCTTSVTPVLAKTLPKLCKSYPTGTPMELYTAHSLAPASTLTIRPPRRQNPAFGMGGPRC